MKKLLLALLVLLISSACSEEDTNIKTNTEEKEVNRVICPIELQGCFDTKSVENLENNYDKAIQELEEFVKPFEKDFNYLTIDTILKPGHELLCEWLKSRNSNRSHCFQSYNDKLTINNYRLALDEKYHNRYYAEKPFINLLFFASHDGVYLADDWIRIKLLATRYMNYIEDKYEKLFWLRNDIYTISSICDNNNKLYTNGYQVSTRTSTNQMRYYLQGVEIDYVNKVQDICTKHNILDSPFYIPKDERRN